VLLRKAAGGVMKNVFSKRSLEGIGVNLEGCLLWMPVKLDRLTVKMIANVPPLLKRGARGDLRGLLNPPKSPFAKGGLAAISLRFLLNSSCLFYASHLNSCSRNWYSRDMVVSHADHGYEKKMQKHSFCTPSTTTTLPQQIRYNQEIYKDFNYKDL